MKKFLAAIILGIILLGIFLNVKIEKVLANGPGPQEISPTTQGLTPSVCCRLRHDFDIDGDGSDDFDKGELVGRPEEGYCAITDGIGGYTKTPFWAGLCTLDGIVTVSDWIKWIAMIVTGVVMVYAGIMFMTAAGNPNRAGKAKTVFLYGLIGVAVALGAQFLPGLARYFIGV